jgi:hypothetical protein
VDGAHLNELMKEKNNIICKHLCFYHVVVVEIDEEELSDCDDGAMEEAE